MTTTEHLQKIKAKCLALLAIAEKRTQGKWGVMNCLWIAKDEQDAEFIAACAGPAEAGWKATVAAIDFLLRTSSESNFQAQAISIIAAWPSELLD